MTTSNFFVMCPEEGFQLCETLDEALDAADERIKCYLTDCWNEDVTDVYVGKITHRAKMCDLVFPDGEIDEDGIDEAGEYWEPDCECKCNYKMMPVEPENLADGVTKLVEALEEARLTLEVMQGRGSSAELTLAIIDRALTTYRKQEGEL